MRVRRPEPQVTDDDDFQPVLHPRSARRTAAAARSSDIDDDAAAGKVCMRFVRA